jgi:hypothetical protein
MSTPAFVTVDFIGGDLAGLPPAHRAVRVAGFQVSIDQWPGGFGCPPASSTAGLNR